MNSFVTFSSFSRTAHFSKKTSINLSFQNQRTLLFQSNRNDFSFIRGNKNETKKGAKLILRDGHVYEDTGDFILSDLSPGRIEAFGRKTPIDLISEAPPKLVDEPAVYCDGGGGALGHPRIFIRLEKPGPHVCGYCGLRFIRKDNHHHDEEH